MPLDAHRLATPPRAVLQESTTSQNEASLTRPWLATPTWRRHLHRGQSWMLVWYAADTGMERRTAHPSSLHATAGPSPQPVCICCVGSNLSPNARITPSLRAEQSSRPTTVAGPLPKEAIPPSTKQWRVFDLRAGRSAEGPGRPLRPLPCDFLHGPWGKRATVGERPRADWRPRTAPSISAARRRFREYISRSCRSRRDAQALSSGPTPAAIWLSLRQGRMIGRRKHCVCVGGGQDEGGHGFKCAMEKIARRAGVATRR